jgi:hypothetical protein
MLWSTGLIKIDFTEQTFLTAFMEKAEVCASFEESKPAEVVKPLAVIDKSLLQGICALPSKRADECLDVLQRKADLVVPPILIEETIVSYLEAHADERAIYQRMLDVLQRLHSRWMEEPLELIFREFTLQQDVRSDLGLNPHMGQMLLDIVKNPVSLSPEAAAWLPARRHEKQERLEARLAYQALRKDTYGADALRFPSLPAFMEGGIKQLCVEVDIALETRMRRLNRYLGRNLKMRHADNADSIEKAFSEATFDSLDKRRFTRNYLLAEVLYDLGSISSYVNEVGDVAHVLPRNPGKQINDEDDQQYVAAALACRRLLTCDRNMHRIATLFSERGIWPGKSLHMPPTAVQRIEDFLC